MISFCLSLGTAASPALNRLHSRRVIPRLSPLPGRRLSQATNRPEYQHRNLQTNLVHSPVGLQHHNHLALQQSILVRSHRGDHLANQLRCLLRHQHLAQRRILPRNQVVGRQVSHQQSRRFFQLRYRRTSRLRDHPADQQLTLLRCLQDNRQGVPVANRLHSQLLALRHNQHRFRHRYQRFNQPPRPLYNQPHSRRVSLVWSPQVSPVHCRQ
jgi:hypothetical protein